MYGRMCWLVPLLVFLGSGCRSLEPSADARAIESTGATVDKETRAGTTDAPPDQTALVDLDKDPHLMGWWKLDQESGTNAPDSSPYRRNGLLLGGGSFDKGSVPGRIGRALSFDGSNEGFVEVSGYRGVSGTSPRTVAAWIQTRAPEGEIVSWGADEGGKMWIFGFIRSGFGVTPRGGYLYSASRVHDGTWHHVAVVVNEAELPNLHDHVVLYKDGEPEEIDGIGLLDLWPIDTASQLDVRIGSGFSGAIDDVRIYDRALSAEEIAILFRATPTGADVSEHLMDLNRRARALTHLGVQ